MNSRYQGMYSVLGLVHHFVSSADLEQGGLGWRRRWYPTSGRGVAVVAQGRLQRFHAVEGAVGQHLVLQGAEPVLDRFSQVA